MLQQGGTDPWTLNRRIDLLISLSHLRCHRFNPKLKSSWGQCSTAPTFYLIGGCKTFNRGQDEIGSVEELCSSVLTTETRLKTLVKVSGPDIECPFNGKFSLAYSQRGELTLSFHSVLNHRFRLLKRKWDAAYHYHAHKITVKGHNPVPLTT